MSDYAEITHKSAPIEGRILQKQIVGKKSFTDFFSLAVATCGVGYLPLAPGTWGSVVGVLLYLAVWITELKIFGSFTVKDSNPEQIYAWIYAINSIGILLFCLVGIWASSRAVKIFQKKDPQKVVVDEVMGQLIVFLFVPFLFSWKMILTGFLLFRLFDIWKPYPISSLENLPTGIGVCADDILAGVYGGVCLSIIYAISFSL